MDNKKTKKITLETLSSGKTVDDNGLSLHTPRDRYLKTQNIDINQVKVKFKMLLVEVLSALLVSFAVISSISSFFKDRPEHYVQPPNGIVEKIEVKR